MPIGFVSEAIATSSFDDFLVSQQIIDRRHELVCGRVYAMAGGLERHDLVAGLFYELVARGSRSCRPFASNRLLRMGAEGAVIGLYAINRG